MVDVDEIRKEVVTTALEEIRQEIREDLIATKKDLKGTRISTFLAVAAYSVIFSLAWTVVLMNVTLPFP